METQIINNFITWDFLDTYVGLSFAVYMLVQYSKEIPFIRNIPTKYYSQMVGFIAILIVKLCLNKFVLVDLPLYLLNSILITFATNGIADFKLKKTSITIEDENNKE